jgi:hypothetical protein
MSIDPTLAPIAIFAYRRVASLASMFKTLQVCPEYSRSRVIVFSDGPRNAAARKDVDAVRAELARLATPNMTVVEAPQNRGLAASIIGGVDQLTREHGRVIVLEDDLRLSPLTLTWMNAALNRYSDEDSVLQVSAHSFAAKAFRQRREAMFMPFITTWGWGTWRRAWDRFDPVASGWEALQTDPALRRRFDLDGSYPYSQMLIDQMESGIDSWGIRWNWSVFMNDGLVLYPPRQFVKNHGLDLKATHGVKSLALSMVKGFNRPFMSEIPEFPEQVSVDPENFATMRAAVLSGLS